MGSIAATTLIKNIRENLNEPVLDSELTNADAGQQWKNSALLEHLNKGKDRLWDIIREVREDYFEETSNTSVTLDGNTKIYSLPTNFRELISIKVTTSGYEYIGFRKVNQYNDEYKSLDKYTATSPNGTTEIIYDIVGTYKLKLANYPPATLATSIDYIKWLADYTLSASSTTDIMDEWREFMEGDATRRALMKTPTDPRLKTWQEEVKGILTTNILKSVGKRDASARKYVEIFNP